MEWWMSWGTHAETLAGWQLGADLMLALVCLLTALGLLALVRVRVDATWHPAVCWHTSGCPCPFRR